MSKGLKRVLAALLVIIGGLVLVQMTEDRFVRMFIVACILFAATYMNRRKVKQREMSELHAKLEKELDEEELAEATLEVVDVDAEIVEETTDNEPEDNPEHL